MHFADPRHAAVTYDASEHLAELRETQTAEYAHLGESRLIRQIF
jgi:hypothetical protein